MGIKTANDNNIKPKSNLAQKGGVFLSRKLYAKYKTAIEIEISTRFTIDQKNITILLSGLTQIIMSLATHIEKRIPITNKSLEAKSFLLFVKTKIPNIKQITAVGI
ncbi:MAG: hypothetical protein HQ402_00390 [Parcubacteria group bacterium]|nr:hypothetical protein [Parcubacteria group bacterium]